MSSPYAKIKSIAAKNNCEVEVSPVYSKTNMYLTMEDGKLTWKEHRSILGFEIGIRNLYGRKGKSEWQWFWFQTLLCPETLEDEIPLIFEHRYSQLTGQYNKGIWEGINACEYILNNA